jgi:hypothetical protein
MKKIILLTLISFILNEELTLTPQTITLDAQGKIKISTKISKSPGTGKVPAVFKIKAGSEDPITLSDCGNFPAFTNADTAVTIECPLVDTIPDGTYAMVAVDSANKVSDGTNDFVVDVAAINTANANEVEIARTEVTATVSKIEASGTGAKITFKTGAAVSGTHSPVGLFNIKKGTDAAVALTCSISEISDANKGKDQTTTCTYPANTAAGEYELQAQSTAVPSGLYKFKVALASDATKTFTISSDSGNKDDQPSSSLFINLSSFLLVFLFLF